MIPPPQDIPPTTPNFEERQSYLESDPGVNMRYAWDRGINGSGITIRVIEYGININHEDLNIGKVRIASGMTINPTLSDDYKNHGTLTAGVIIADKGEYGASGLAYNANEYILYPQHTVENLFNPGLAVSNAIADSKKGDVIIYEMQTFTEEGNVVLQEYEPVIWDLTKAATENGIIVVASAGNVGQN